MRIYKVTWDTFEFCNALSSIQSSPRSKRFMSLEKAKQYAATLRDAWESLRIDISPTIHIYEEEVEE